MPRLQLLNCFWLLLPVFAWNAIFASRLPQVGFKSDAGVPHTILVAEQVLRIAVFVWPLLLPMSWQDPRSRAGLAWIVPNLICMWIPETLLVPFGVSWPSWLEILRIVVIPPLWQTALVALGLRITHEIGCARIRYTLPLGPLAGCGKEDSQRGYTDEVRTLSCVASKAHAVRSVRVYARRVVSLRPERLRAGRASPGCPNGPSYTLAYHRVPPTAG